MIEVTKGLVIADPWIGYILDGTKTWEMRSTETSLRGSFALIRKGSGSGAVWGVATLANIGRRMSPQEMIETVHHHRIPAEMIRSGEVAKWNVPWILSDVQRLETPVPYEHPSGAVTWVNLDHEVSRTIADQLKGASAADPTGSGAEIPALKPATAPERVRSDVATGEGPLIAQTQLTDGNIKNSHFYLRGQIHRFPSELVGGSNKSEKAAREAFIEWGGPILVVTDIDGEKQFFRARGWIKQFFEMTDACAGDHVLVEEAGPYRYRVSLRKA
jgi:hypothetical protein